MIRGSKVKLDHFGGSWIEELPSILWLYRTTPREGMSMTSFHLVYKGEAVVPIEIEMRSTRVDIYGKANTEKRLLELDLLEETHDREVV